MSSASWIYWLSSFCKAASKLNEAHGPLDWKFIHFKQGFLSLMFSFSTYQFPFWVVAKTQWRGWYINSQSLQ
jgi:hypothetical protein